MGRGIWAMIFGGALVLGLAFPDRAGAAGQATTVSLEAVGGRGAAMGDAQTAAVEGADALFWNPAALARLDRSEATFMYNKSFDSVDQDVVHWALPIDQQGTFGLGLASQRLDVKGYDDNGAPTRNLWAGETLLTAGWGQTLKTLPLLPGLQTGASLKGFQKKLGENSSSIAVMTDLGLLYETQSGPFQGLRSGFVLQNLGTSLSFLSEKERLPLTAKTGWAWPFPGGLTAALDVAFAQHEDPQFHMGFEYRPRDVVAFRLGGVSRRSAGAGIAYGIGLGDGRLHVDYAFVPAGDLGASHRVSLGVRFGSSQEKSSGPAELLYEAGLELYKQEKYEQALEEFQRVLALDPHHAGAARRAALCRERVAKQSFQDGKDAASMGSWARAVDYFGKAVKMDPDSALIRSALNTAQLELKERLKVDSGTLSKEAGEAFVAGDLDKAMGLWSKALEEDPENAAARTGVDKVKQLRPPPAPAKPADGKISSKSEVKSK